MASRKKIDQRPGCLPEIRAGGDSVTFLFDVAGVDADTRLIIRCNPDGRICASIERANTQ